MNNRRRIVVLVAACLAASLTVPVVAAAQPQANGRRLGAQAGQPPREGQPALSPADVQSLFDAYALVQAQQTLNLSDDQFAQFIPRLKVLQETRRKNQQERHRLIVELDQLSKQPTVDEAQVRDRLKALSDLEARAPEDLHKAYAAIDQLLDVRQQARFRVFEEQIERRKFDLLMRARRQRGVQGAPMNPPGRPQGE